MKIAVTFLLGASLCLSGYQSAFAQGADRNLLARVVELEAQVAALQAAIGTDSNFSVLEGRVSAIEANTVLQLDGRLSLDFNIDPAHPVALFEAVNVQVTNGIGISNSVNGLGNLIVGYNEPNTEAPFSVAEKTGSHNLVIGREHDYTSFGGFVAGFRNTISGEEASVSGGFLNNASGIQSSVSGGQQNEASGTNSSVSGGVFNNASGTFASVSGGVNNKASGKQSSVSGGESNNASGPTSSVSGGVFNNASGIQSSVSGGGTNNASGIQSSVSGGAGRTASGDSYWVAGGLLQRPGIDF